MYHIHYVYYFIIIMNVIITRFVKFAIHPHIQDATNPHPAALCPENPYHATDRGLWCQQVLFFWVIIYYRCHEPATCSAMQKKTISSCRSRSLVSASPCSVPKLNCWQGVCVCVFLCVCVCVCVCVWLSNCAVRGMAVCICENVCVARKVCGQGYGCACVYVAR